MSLASTGSLGTSYGNPMAIARELQYTGIKHVRDSLDIGSNLPNLQELNSLVGAKFDLVYGDYASTAGSAVITAAIDNVQSSANIIEAIEGPNEPDNFGLWYNEVQYYVSSTPGGGGSAVIDSQELIYQLVKGNANLQNTPVYCPAFAYPAFGSSNGPRNVVGNLAAYCDYAPLHAYVWNTSLGSYLTYQYIQEWAQFPDTVTAIGKPEVITEGGWDTAQNGTYGVDQATHAKYTLEYLLDAFGQGMPRTYLYELSDDAVDPASSVDASDFGLFSFTGIPKKAATMLANLQSLLRSGSVTPGSLAYSLENMPANGHQLLLEKSNGVFVLALWNEANLWNGTAHEEIPLASVQVLLSLGAEASSIQVFDPLVGTAAQSTTTNAQGLTIMIPDHPILVFITPQP